MLPQGPATLALTFSEPVRPLVARLIDPQGRTHLLTDQGGRGETVVLKVPAGLEEGTHILSWRVASSDGHPIGGGLLFSVGAPSAAAAPAADQPDMPVRLGLWAARFLMIGGLVFGVGGAAFRLFGGGEGTRLVPAALGAGLLGAALLVPMQGLDALGLPLDSLPGVDVWSAGLWATSYGTATLLAATAILLAFASLQQGRARAAGLLAAPALLIAGLAFACAGHAASAPPRWAMAGAVFVHAGAAMLWLGALAPLGLTVAAGGSVGATALRRFSAAIPFVIAALLASGVAIALVQLRTPAALLTSDYGRVLAAKLGLVAVMLVLAAVNRFVLTQPAARGDPMASRRLSRSIKAEIALSVAVIAVLGLWRFTPPPRAMAADPARFEVQQVAASNDGVSALLSIRPPIAGPVRVDVAEIAVDGRPLTPLGVSVELDKPSYGIGPFAKEARPAGAGVYSADGYLLPLDGFWVVKVTILVSDFRSVTLTEVFDVRKAAN